MGGDYFRNQLPSMLVSLHFCLFLRWFIMFDLLGKYRPALFGFVLCYCSNYFIFHLRSFKLHFKLLCWFFLNFLWKFHENNHNHNSAFHVRWQPFYILMHISYACKWRWKWIMCIIWVWCRDILLKKLLWWCQIQRRRCAQFLTLLILSQKVL